MYDEILGGGSGIEIGFFYFFIVQSRTRNNLAFKVGVQNKIMFFEEYTDVNCVHKCYHDSIRVHEGSELWRIDSARSRTRFCYGVHESISCFK